MANSFLDQSGLPLGLRNNNPGNLRPLPGGVKWQGEIAPDTIHNFSRFSDVAWGLRAMITDISGDITQDGLNTIRKLVYAYAPPSDNNNTAAYIQSVSNSTGWLPDQVINPTAENIERLVRAKLQVELGSTGAARITSNDLREAFSRLADYVKNWLKIADSATGGNLGLWLILALVGTVIVVRNN